MPPVQPQSPNPDFDFILKDSPKAGRSIKLPKPMLIVGAALLLIILIIIIGSVLGSRGKNFSKATLGAVARGQETLRVTAAVQQLNLQDPSTKALASTVNSTLTSDQQQLEDYLAKNKVKVSKLQLNASLDKNTDTAMQTASQNNNLDQAYIDYLRQSLAKYQADLQSAYGGVGPNGKIIVKDSLNSVNTLLTNPPLKT
jgi:hypothetical protein